MRIAQLAPLAESVPPKLYGGTERVVAWLVDELVVLGRDVTLFASGDSRTKGELHPTRSRLSGPWAIWAGSTDEKCAPASRNASPRTEWRERTNARTAN
jgi:hypothetical protein